MKILVVEDEIRMAQALCELLKLEGYEVDHCDNGADGLHAINSGLFDAVILDVMLPLKNGFDVMKEVRRNGIRTPVLMLTAKSELDDKVNGLDCGADDYLTKPFMTKELLARIRALLRRNANASDDAIAFGDIALEKSTAMLRCKDTGREIRLSEKEYRLMEYMLVNGGQILSREQLALKIWGYDCEAEYNNVEVYMSFVRKKLAYVGARTEIKAVRGIGYELRISNV